MGCLWCVKYSRQCKTMPSGPREFIPPFIPVTGMKCSYGKISSPLTDISVGKTEISGTEPARPLIWTHRKFYEGFRGKARSRKPGQPAQPGSCEEALNDRVYPFLPYVPFCSVLAAPVYTDVRCTGVKPTEAHLVSKKTRCSMLTKPGKKFKIILKRTAFL